MVVLRLPGRAISALPLPQRSAENEFDATSRAPLVEEATVQFRF